MAASRRGLLFAIVGALAAARFGVTGILSAAAAEVFGPEVPIGDDHVIGLARDLSKQAYVPPSEKDDKALQAAFNQLRGVTVNADAPGSVKRPVPN